ncbi:hypothetical protein [Pedobacter alluvionis]|uniref:Uncharacterized protein n=1 Tax=Pedobacter alluvionis TaxID=475253 RepID=A0A497Y9B3_9SPHI|nr:hypothetical protein [Pedobacter alluvionis]RLJ79421.1 hypothetical protein BCL90_0114 [Pedobacter alluvionis]TFB30770.1 hypothetical protein E3V97_09025 [Pedobacter alluvionis]
MADHPLIDGDHVQFEPVFMAAFVTVAPGTITGSGKSVAGGKKICVEGDEASVVVAGCNYVAPPFDTPGTGTIKIAKLGPDQLSLITTDSAKKIILKGRYFIAKFQVQQPAVDPKTSAPDPQPSYPGKGHFITTNFKITID